MGISAENAMHGHTDEESAYVVDDYPYGFRLRTQIRYWIETTKHGDRMCSQTMNPKTARWNKPKKSTYSKIAAMYRDEAGHVQHAGVGDYIEPAALADFLAAIGGEAALSGMQKDRLAEIEGLRKAYEGVTWSVSETPATPEENRKQAAISRVLAMRTERETQAARERMGD